MELGKKVDTKGLKTPAEKKAALRIAEALEPLTPTERQSVINKAMKRLGEKA